MQELFKDLLSTDGVTGIMLFSPDGDLLFEEFPTPVKAAADHQNWRFLIESLEGMRETDLIFEKGRIYIRKTEMGFLVVLMALYAPIAMVRLNCDILSPSLQPSKPGRKFGRFFKK
jgi:hypothetical protein